MATDWYTRLVLTIAAAALVALAVQGQRTGGASEEGRYSFVPLPMARMAVRFDRETGEAWTAMFPDLRIWTKVAETPGDLLDRPPADQPAPAPALPGPAEEPIEPGGAEAPAQP